MKQKLKLIILRIEGWRESTTIKNHFKHNSKIEEGTMLFYAFTLEEAWDEQFTKFRDILQTKLFWLIFSVVLGALFMLFSDHSTVIKNGIHWFNYAGGICFLFPVGYTLYAIGYILYYWIKNLLNRKK